MTLFTLSIFLISIWSLSFYASRILREDMQRMLGEQQFSTVTFIAEDVNDELDDRLRVLEIVAAGIGAKLLGDTAALQAFLEQRLILPRMFNGGFIAYKLDGTAIAEFPRSAGRIGVNYMDIDTVAAALKEGKSTFGRPVMGKKLGAPVFGMSAPIRDANGKVIGALSGVTNLGLPNFLNKIAVGQYGRTGGYLLIAPQHRLVVAATDRSRIMEVLPAPGVNPLIDRFIQGYEGSQIFVNPRGVEVLASAKRVPVAGWYLTAQLPTDEAFAPVREMQRSIFMAAVVLTLLSAGLIWWMLRRELSPMLDAARALAVMSATEQPLQPLRIARQDEIGNLIGGFNRLLKTLAQRDAALKEHEDRYRLLFDTSLDAILLATPEGRILAANASACRMFQRTEEEIRQVGRGGLVDASDPRLAAGMEERARTGRFEGEINFVRGDGTKFPGEISTVAFRNKEGQAGTTVIVRDVTARKRAEAELRTLSRAIEQSPVSIVITDHAGNIEYVNPRFEQVTGYSRAEAVGKNPRILKSDATPAATYADLWKTIAAGGEWRGELCNRRKNGDLFWEYAAISGLKDESGKVGHYIAVKEDITERKRADSALRESESRLSAIFRANPIAISVSRIADGRVLDINDAALRLYGATREEIVGRVLIDLGIYADPAQRTELTELVAARGQVEQYELAFRNRRGGFAMVELTGRVIELQGEQCLVSMMVDITERKRLEQVHLRAQKLESLGTLAGGIAHDFNNILAAIQGNADLAAEDAGADHNLAESLEEIRKASVRGSELVRRIMAFGRPRESQLGPVDLSAVVAEVLMLLRSTLPAGIALRTDFAGDTPRVLADSGQIHEVIVNLTTNAAYAIGPRAGAIDYRLEPVQLGEEMARSGIAAGRYARLTVTDSGCGMDVATQARIFDAFYTTKPVGEGTGLGLSMVHGIVHSYGGAVTVESAPGQGARFALYFPAASGKTADKEGGAAVQSVLPAGLRVLYVDDETSLVSLASRMLSRLGYQVSGFIDPREALDAFRAHPLDHDVVVTDLSMPYMTGLEFAREVLAVRAGIPVLLTSGYLRAEDEENARAAGILERIPKPVTMEELGQVLQRLFHDRESGAKRPA